MAPKNLKDFLSDDTLDLSLNNLQDVPVKDIAQLPKATSLDLSNNKLTFLSKSFATSLTHLVKLDLARNELSELPKNFGCLVNLKHLDLYKNKLENLPLSFGNLKSLRWLDLKENPLERHWQQIVGPCLNAQDCRNAAKSVVNIAGIMKFEIDAEVQRSSSRQNHSEENEENEQKEQKRKKEKQKEKKKRKLNAKLAAPTVVNTFETDSIVAEPISDVEEELVNIPKETSLFSYWSLRSTISSLLRGLFYAAFILVLALYILKYVNEPLYKQIWLNINPNNNNLFTLMISENMQRNISRESFKFLNHTKQVIIKFWSIISKNIVTFYAFVTTDPNFEIFLKNVIFSISYLYVIICNSTNLLFSTIFDSITSLHQ